MGSRSLLRSPVQYLKGVGPRRAAAFERLDVETGRDLLYHVPHRYEDATTVTPIATLEPGDEATVIARIVSKGVIDTRKKLRIFRAVLRDDSGLMEAAWPGQPWLDRSLSRGDVILASGPVRFFHGRQLQPREFVVLQGADEAREEARERRRAGSAPPGDGEAPPGGPGGGRGGSGRGGDDGAAAGAAVETGFGGRVFPVYPATEGLSHRQIRGIVRTNLDDLLDEVEERELFDQAWRKELGLPSLREALATLHAPDRLERVEAARRRLAYEELFLLQLLHARARVRRDAEEEGVACDSPGALVRGFLEALPFRFTGAQERVWAEIRRDLESDDRMYRLLQGDVGSGKTVVAAAAILQAVENGRQAALMAPTEVLAEQHHRTLHELLAPVDVPVVLLTGSVRGAERDDALEGLRSGRISMVVGTHALIQDGVAFEDLGLVVVDEQHRFGVEQRRLLRDAGSTSDALVMSATPIPRSLALTLYGDLDLSTLDEMPPGRSPVVTGVRGPEDRKAAFDFLEEQLREGRQAYVVYPLIEESESVDARAVEVMHERLVERFETFEVGLLHGRLASDDKDAVMRAFQEGRIDVLVCTTVVEVGIDVPNATVMVIENAERFGLAQLHQLRGRVGRGEHRSYCVAFSSEDPPPERLRIFASTRDGFELAEADLRLRGQGDLFGTAQHGLPPLRFADLERDARLLEHARRRARELAEEDPELSRPGHRAFSKELAERYGEAEALYDVG